MARKRNKRNQRIKPKRSSPPWQRRIAVSVVFVLVVLSVSVLILDQLMRPDLFTVERVHYFGTFERVAPSELERAVNPTVHGNLLALDLKRVEKAANAIPWVESVVVQRKLPNALSVAVTEQRLIARWLPGGWINRLGEVVDLPNGASSIDGVADNAQPTDGGSGTVANMAVADRQASPVVTLPELAGPPGSSAMVLSRYRRWGALLAGKGMRLARLQLTEGRMWSAQVVVSGPKAAATGGSPSGAQIAMAIVIGQHHPEKRLARFARIFRSALDVRLADVASVDLRYPNGFAVQWRTPPQQQPNPVSAPSKGAKQA